MQDIVFFFPEGHTLHQEPGHPERPDRVEAIRRALKEAGYWTEERLLPPLPVPRDVLYGVHTSTYLQRLQSNCQAGRRLDADTYTTPASWDLAVKAAGGTLAVAGAVWRGGEDRTTLPPDAETGVTARRGFALPRPPGHHATSGQGMGFCLLNNIALAAEWLLRYTGAQRLAILDLDLHHGNGTQEIFWQRNDVFYLSIHQSPLYPGSGGLTETGDGPGKGYTANLPLPPGSGDGAFAAVLQEWVLPLLGRVRPEMLLVSAGFDPHWRDPLGSLQVSVDGCARAVSALAGWADRHCHGRIALVLEGGYDLEAGAACTLAMTAALLGRPWHDPLGTAPIPETGEWKIVLDRAKSLWGV